MQQEERSVAPAHSRRLIRRTLIGPWLDTASPILRYGIAAATVLVVTLLRAVLNPLLGTSTPLLPLIPAVLFTALVVGRGPAYFASGFAPALLMCSLWLDGKPLDWMPWLAHGVFFVVVGVIVVAIIHALQRTYVEQTALLAEANASERRALSNELQLQLIADSVPVLVSYLDREHRYRFVNGHYERWFGVSRLDIIGKHAREVLGDAVYDAVRPEMDQALQGQPVAFERPLTYAAGGERFVRGRYVPRKSLDGIVLGFFAVIEDASESKRFEQQLVDLHQHLSLALRAGRSGTFEWDVKTNANLWSDELQELYGFRPGEFVGTHAGWLECVIAEDRERIAASAEQALEEGENRIEFRIRRRDTGELRWIQARSKVFYDHDGKPARMVGANTDITEHKLAAEALADRERTLQLIYDNSSDGIALLEVQSQDALRIVTVNATLLRMTGLRRDKAEGQLLEHVVPHPHWPLLLAKCREAITSGERVSFDTDMDFPAGRRLNEVTLIPVTSARGLHLLSCVTDVTKEKMLEATQRAEAKRKDEFLAMLAHELRNPLVPIRNVAHLLAKQQVAATKCRDLGLLIERQTKHLTRLVDDLLDVSRITRGVLELNREQLVLDEILQQAGETLTSMLNVKRQSLQVHQQTARNLVIGDRARLVQVFTNLLSNASKYSPEDTAIELHVEQRDRSVIVRVIDRGEGIHPQMIGMIFELFVQADKSLDRRNGGLGVGLTIAKRLVELHGGQIGVHSAGLGQGSEFTVHLPLAIAADPEAEIVSLPSATAPPAPAAAATRVMIVDDSVSAAATLGMLLEIEGFEVRSCHDGRSALEALETYEPHVMLLDIGLPDIDGYLVARAVRDRFAGRPIRIIAVTGYGTTADQALALHSGFDVHLTKPVEPEVLLRTIRDAPEPGEKTAATHLAR